MAEEIPWEKIARARLNPIQVRLIEIFAEGGEWSPVRLAAELDVPLSKLSYHVSVLARMEVIRMTRTKPRRGASEHFYRWSG